MGEKQIFYWGGLKVYQGWCFDLRMGRKETCRGLVVKPCCQSAKVLGLELFWGVGRVVGSQGLRQ